MLRSFVLRLSQELLADGHLVGHVELVDTGERIGVRGADELLAVIRGSEPGAAFRPVIVTDALREPGAAPPPG